MAALAAPVIDRVQYQRGSFPSKTVCSGSKSGRADPKRKTMFVALHRLRSVDAAILSGGHL